MARVTGENWTTSIAVSKLVMLRRKSAPSGLATPTTGSRNGEERQTDNVVALREIAPACSWNVVQRNIVETTNTLFAAFGDGDQLPNPVGIHGLGQASPAGAANPRLQGGIEPRGHGLRPSWALSVPRADQVQPGHRARQADTTNSRRPARPSNRTSTAAGGLNIPRRHALDHQGLMAVLRRDRGQQASPERLAARFSLGYGFNSVRRVNRDY